MDDPLGPSELLPCPFCGVGVENELGPCPNYGIRQKRGEVWFVTCGCNTGPQTDDFATVEEAIAAWNSRRRSTRTAEHADLNRPRRGFLTTLAGGGEDGRA
jgi:hypothetical protein